MLCPCFFFSRLGCNPLPGSKGQAYMKGLSYSQGMCHRIAGSLEPSSLGSGQSLSLADFLQHSMEGLEMGALSQEQKPAQDTEAGRKQGHRLAAQRAHLLGRGDTHNTVCLTEDVAITRPQVNLLPPPPKLLTKASHTTAPKSTDGLLSLKD